MPSPDYLISRDNNCTNGDFPGIKGLLRFKEGLPHEILIIERIHAERSLRKENKIIFNP